MKKKILIIMSIFVISLMATLLVGCMNVEKMEFKLNAEGTEYTMSRYSGKSTIFETSVPDEYMGKPVTKIGEHALANAQYLTKLTIGKNIKVIDAWGIANCINLETIEVAKGNTAYTVVDDVLFTKDLKTLMHFPSSRKIIKYTEINDKGKEEKKQKNDVYNIPQGTEAINDHAFYKCVYLQQIEIPSSVKTIGKMAFLECTALKDLKFNEGLVEVKIDAFTGCGGVSELKLPSTLTTLGDFAFYKVNGIDKVHLKRSLEGMTLGSRCFPEVKDNIFLKKIPIEENCEH